MPYIPLDEIDAPALTRNVPLADGRGVTIGIVEGSIDYTHPALQVARTLDGDVVPKVAGLIDPTWLLPADDAADDHPRSMLVADTSVSSETGVVVYEGHRVVLPAPGEWQMGTWHRTGRVDRGTITSTTPFLVAWRDSTEAWIDVNRNHDFRDDVAISNINIRFAAGVFPADDSTGRSENSFAVAFDGAGRPRVYSVSRDSYSHTTMVAGVAAGASYQGGTGGGVAPGARIILVMVPGGRVSSFVESLLVAVRDPRIDVVTHQGDGFSAFPHAASAFPGVVLERIATHYDKPIFVSAANAGRFGSVGLRSAPPGIVSVGAYVSQRSYRVNEGIEATDQDNVALYSSRGPMPDGSRKPDLLAPVQWITTASCADTASSYGVRMRPGTRPPVIYSLPQCYMLAGGTSSAAPAAAGAAALLISAARLQGLPPLAATGRAIRWALLGSARRLTTVELHKQGAGLVQVGPAWSLLRAISPEASSKPESKSAETALFQDIDVRAPVRNAYAGYLVDSIGAGLYIEAAAGSRTSYTVLLERQSGSTQPVHYALRWQLNEGTFSLESDTVILPRGAAVPVEIGIAPREIGLHEDALELTDPVSGTVVRRVPVAVITPATLDARSGFRVEWRGETGPARSRLLPVAVPARTRTLRIDLRSRHGGTDLLWHGPIAAGTATMTPLSASPDDSVAVLTIDDPFPGTWALEVSARSTAGTNGAVYHVTVSAEPVDREPGRDRLQR